MLSSFVLLALLVGDPTTAAWPAFLGQGASTIDSSTIPLQWSPTENIAWKAKLPGKGQSSPVIWGNKVFVTCIEGSMKDTCHLVCLSLSDGSELWRQSFPSVQPVRSTYTQSRSAPTPVVDAKGVYAFYETGNLVACSHDGQLIWQRDIVSDYGAFESTIGLASSPTVHEDTLILLVDHEGPSYLLGIDTASGQEKWKTDRTSRSSFASPIIHRIAGTPQIVCSSSGSIDGYDPATGELLWSFEENIGGNRTGGPMPICDGTFTVSGTPGMHNEREAEARNTNMAMKVERVDGQYVPKVLWRTTEAMPAYNSPMTHQNLSYWVTKAGIVFCYNSQTGEQVYAKRACGTCWATPVAMGDRVYLFGKDGQTVVISAGPEFSILSENNLWNPDEIGRDSRPSRGMSSGRGRQDREHTGHPSDNDSTANKPATDTTAVGSSSKKPEISSASTANDSKSQSNTERQAAQSNEVVSRRKDQDAQAANSGVDSPQAGSAKPNEQPANTDGSQIGDARFADPVQYGVAVVNGSLVIRTGEVVYCVRSPK